jgi:D-glycero-D-manno-heptose 1,7-bisphosphate phosphatase
MGASAKGDRAVFLDRDGVLVVPEFREGRSFAPRRLEDFGFYEAAKACVERLKSADYRVVVVTNQPDVGSGLIQQSVVEEMHRRLRNELSVDEIQVCYHTSSDACACRKPRPGMLLDAARKLGLDLSRSVMIGDRASDVDAGIAAGCRTVFIDLGYREPRPARADFVVTSLSEATEIVLNEI